jgi:WD40 repeat protein
VNGFNSQETRDKHEAAHVWRYKCKELNCFMGDRGFKKQRDLNLHSLKYHPRPKAPELILDLPPLTPDPLSRTLEGLTIEYAPDVERSFSVELLHQFHTESVCFAAAISPDRRYFAVATKKMIQVCSLESGEEVMRFEVRNQMDHDEYLRDVLFTPDSNFLVGAGEAREVMVCYHASTLWLHTHVCRRVCLR